MQPPILISAPGRTGTTMIAGLLYHHGVFIGEAAMPKVGNPPLGTENIKIKAYLSDVALEISPDKFQRDILNFVETDGPWCVKTVQNLKKWKVWRAAFPSAKWVLPHRSVESTVASSLRHPQMGVKGRQWITDYVVRLKAMQEEVAGGCKHVLWIDPDKLARKQLKEATRLFDFCNLPLNIDVFNRWIEPERWHGA